MSYSIHPKYLQFIFWGFFSDFRKPKKKDRKVGETFNLLWFKDPDSTKIMKQYEFYVNVLGPRKCRCIKNLDIK